MRRFISVLFLILGGWVLLTETFVAGLDIQEGAGVTLAMIGVLAGMALPFLLLGTWISPGARWAELGLTLMIAAGLGAFFGLLMMSLVLDPGMKKLMPPDMPQLRFNPLLGIANLLLMGGSGYALWRWGRKRGRT
jgi:hypothetical protein